MDTQHGRPCSLATALELVGDRWALLAVRDQFRGIVDIQVVAFAQDMAPSKARTSKPLGTLMGLRPTISAPRFKVSTI